MIVTTIIFMVLFGVIMFGLSNQLNSLINQMARVGDNLKGIEDKLSDINQTQRLK